MLRLPGIAQIASFATFVVKPREEPNSFIVMSGRIYCSSAVGPNSVVLTESTSTHASRA